MMHGPLNVKNQRITQYNSFEHRWWENYKGGEPHREIFCPSVLQILLPKLSCHVGILSSIFCASLGVGIDDKLFNVIHMKVSIQTPHSHGMYDSACCKKFYRDDSERDNTDWMVGLLWRKKFSLESI